MPPTLPPAATTLAVLQLPDAPPVVRAAAPARARRRWPGLVLLVIGAVLVVGPVVGGVFTRTASGQQLIDAFEPHLTPDALGRYDADLATLRAGAAAVDDVYRDQDVPAGTYPGVDAFRRESPAIDRRASTLLDRVRAADPDYRRVAAVGGFNRVPFLLVASGLALTYSGAVLVSGRRRRTAGAAALALAAAGVLVAYPLVGDLPSGTRAGERLVQSLAPVMRDATVRQQQDDFVVLVHAVGELDTTFRDVPGPGAGADGVKALVTAWPSVSSDLAGLVGTINDTLTDYRALDDLDGLTRGVGVSGLVALPWTLIGAGAIAAGAAAATLVRPRKELP